MKSGWLAPECLSWNASLESAREAGGTDRHRAYEHLAHAEKLLAMASTDEMHLIDVVTTLKRCVNHRLQDLNAFYDFSSAPLRNRPKRLLDQLAAFDLIRPFLLQHLIDIRNAVEHEDESPPSHERCAELTDVVWYFLRSTDSVASRKTTTFILECPQHEDKQRPFWMQVRHPWIEVTSLPGTRWSFGLTGHVLPQMTSFGEISGWIAVELLDYHSYVRLISPGGEPRMENYYSFAIGPNGWRSIHGPVLGPFEAIEAIAKLSLSVS